MTGMPVTTYIVSVFEAPHWRTVLTTTDINKALAKAKEIGGQVRIERRVQCGGS
jgi:predicted enzyme related to lactoylglutathione lyase